jgi:hypothetical protein
MAIIPPDADILPPSDDRIFKAFLPMSTSNLRGEVSPSLHKNGLCPFLWSYPLYGGQKPPRNAPRKQAPHGGAKTWVSHATPYCVDFDVPVCYCFPYKGDRLYRENVKERV